MYDILCIISKYIYGEPNAVNASMPVRVLSVTEYSGCESC